MVGGADINRSELEINSAIGRMSRCTRMFRNGCDAKMFNVNAKTQYYSGLSAFAGILDKSRSENRLAR